MYTWKAEDKKDRLHLSSLLPWAGPTSLESLIRHAMFDWFRCLGSDVASLGKL